MGDGGPSIRRCAATLIERESGGMIRLPFDQSSHQPYRRCANAVPHQPHRPSSPVRRGATAGQGAHLV